MKLLSRAVPDYKSDYPDVHKDKRLYSARNPCLQPSSMYNIAPD